MRKHKRQFGDYEEIALDLRTVKQLLYQADILFHRAAYSDAITAICKRIDKLISKTEIEMFNDWPEEASADVFYGGGGEVLDVRKKKKKNFLLFFFVFFLFCV